MLVNKNILIISSQRWDHIFVSKHHYAVHLARRGNKVFFLNPPSRQNEVSVTRFPGVYEVNYKGFPPGLRFYPRILQARIVLKVFGMLEKMCGTQLDVVWSFDNSVFFDFSAIDSKVLKISHIVDLNQDFEIRKAASTADFCFCTSEFIKDELSKYSASVYKINHGCHFPMSVPGDNGERAKGKIVAVYAGNLAIPYIDWPLLLEVVQEHPQVDFVFAGPNGHVFDNSISGLAKRKVVESGNVLLPGQLATDELVELYHLTDILLLAYQEAHHEQVANPHKMMEYLGTGKVIVATFTKEYEFCEDLLVMSAKNEHMPREFRKVINNLSSFNNEVLARKRTEFAKDNSYENQIRRIEAIIFSH